MLNEAMNPSVQFDRDNQVMAMRAYEARGKAISAVLNEIEQMPPW